MCDFKSYNMQRDSFNLHIFLLLIQNGTEKEKKLTAPTSTSVQRKRKQWSDANMIKALEEVANGKLSIQFYNICQMVC